MFVVINKQLKKSFFLSTLGHISSQQNSYCHEKTTAPFWSLAFKGMNYELIIHYLYRAFTTRLSGLPQLENTAGLHTSYKCVIDCPSNCKPACRAAGPPLK